MSENLTNYWIKNWEYFINFDHTQRIMADNAIVLPMCDKEKEWILSVTMDQINDYVARVLYYYW